MMKKTIICFAIVLAGLSAAYAGGGPKQAKVMGTIKVAVTDLVDGPVMQDSNACAAYQTTEGAVSVSVFDTKGNEVKNPVSMANATDIQVIGFKKYAVVVKAMVDGKVRLFSYKLGKKGVKVLGSTAADSKYLAGKAIISAASDGKTTWVVTQDINDDSTLGAQTLIQYTNKLEGVWKKTAVKAAYPKSTYSPTAIGSEIMLPNVQNKYKYDVTKGLDDEGNVTSISIKVIK